MTGNYTTWSSEMRGDRLGQSGGTFDPGATYEEYEAQGDLLPDDRNAWPHVPMGSMDGETMDVRGDAAAVVDAIAAEVLADRIFAGLEPERIDAGGISEHFDGAPDEYVARLALHYAEVEVQYVVALQDRLRRQPFGGGDPETLAALQRLARTAWTHHRRARAAASDAAWAPAVRPLAARAVARAQRAARAISLAAARALTRAAVAVRRAAHARTPVPVRGAGARRREVRSRRPRATPTRRVRLSAVASAGSGGEEPSSDPPGRRDRGGSRAGRRR
jgi:hypothetical protein